MAKYSVTIAANIRAYTTITIEAESEDAACERVEDIIAMGFWNEPETAGKCFDPEFDMIDDFAAVDYVEIEEDEVAA